MGRGRTKWFPKILVVLLAYTTGVAAEQQALPYSWSVPAGVLEQVLALTLPPVTAQRTHDLSNGSRRLHLRAIMALASQGFTERDIVDEGVWTQLPGGGQLWRQVITSPGASSQTLVFSDVHLPPGAALFVLHPEAAARSLAHCGTASCQRYSALASRVLTTPPIDGDTVLLEYVQPASASKARSAPVLRLATVMQARPYLEGLGLKQSAATGSARRRRRRRLASADAALYPTKSATLAAPDPAPSQAAVASLPGQLLGQVQGQGGIRVRSHAPAAAPLASQPEGLAPLPSQALAVQLGAEPKQALQPNQALQSDMVPQGFASVKPGAAVQGPSPEEPDQALADAAAGLSRSPNPAQTLARVSANPFAAVPASQPVPGGMQSPSSPSQGPPSLGSNPFGAAAPAPALMVAELRQRAEAQRGAAAAAAAFAAVAAPAAAPQSALSGGRTTVPPISGGGRPIVAGMTSSAGAASSPQPVVGSGGPVPEAAGMGGASVMAIGTLFNVGLLQQRFATVEACTASSACEPGFEREAAAVVDIYAVSLSAGAMGLCSGSVISTPLNGNFVLTSGHCYTDKSALQDFHYWLIIFNYEAPCGSPDAPPLRHVLQGVKLRFFNPDVDVLLLELPAAIPSAFKPFLLGWDATSEAPPRAAVGIHYPHGGPRAITFTKNISADFVALAFPVGEVQPTNQTHYAVYWDQGATMGGSSGSPLVDVATRRVVGVLTGGFSSCATPELPDYYGRMSEARPQGPCPGWILLPDASAGRQLPLSAEVQSSCGRHAWYGGLRHFLAVEPSAENVTGLAALPAPAAQRFRDGQEPAPQAAGLNFYPPLVVYTPSITSRELTYYLTERPAPGEVVTVTATVEDLPGNSQSLVGHVATRTRTANFVAADFGKQFVGVINVSGIAAPVPGGLQRFSLALNVTSSLRPGEHRMSAIKGIVADAERAWWTEYLPVVIRDLPFHVYAPVASPSGRAVFELRGLPDNTTVDLKVCGPIASGGTMSIYRDGAFLWTIDRDSYNDPLCLHVPGVRLRNATYNIVISDSDELGAVLPMAVMSELYIGLRRNASRA